MWASSRADYAPWRPGLLTGRGPFPDRAPATFLFRFRGLPRGAERAAACGTGRSFARRAELPADRRPLDAADEARVDAIDRRGALDRHQPAAQLGEQRAQLEAGQVRTETHVLAAAEADVVVRAAIDAERERVLEHLLVAVARRVEQAHRLALLHQGVTHADVARGRARELVHRRHPAHGLLDHAVDEVRIPDQPVELLRVVDQLLHTAGHRVARGLVSRDHEQEVVGEELEHGERLAVDLAVHDHGEDVVLRILLALLRERREVSEQVFARGVAGLTRGPTVLILGILGRDDLVRPAEQERPVSFGNPEHEGDHRDRDGCRYLGHEVELTLGGRLVEDLARQLLDLGLPDLDGARREPLRHDLP